MFSATDMCQETFHVLLLGENKIPMSYVFCSYVLCLMYLMFYTQSTAKGHIRAKRNAFLQLKLQIRYSIHIPPLKIEEIWRILQGYK